MDGDVGERCCFACEETPYYICFVKEVRRPDRDGLVNSFLRHATGCTFRARVSTFAAFRKHCWGCASEIWSCAGGLRRGHVTSLDLHILRRLRPADLHMGACPQAWGAPDGPPPAQGCGSWLAGRMGCCAAFACCVLAGLVPRAGKAYV